MVKQWLNKWWYVGGYVLLSMLIALFVSLAFPVSAADPVQADKNCVHIATANNIKIFRCIDEETGIEFYVNQQGFMMFEIY